MTYIWQRWMVEDFRAAGLTVVEVEGWENRGRPASTGQYNPDGAQTKHHTGVTSSPSNPHPTLRTLIVGRPDLPGPLAPWSTGADGTVYVIAAGRCNHAGRVGKSGVPGMPYGADGNALAMGDEIDTNGTQTMPQVQRDAIAIASAVTMRHFNRGADWIHRHADISATGKWDLGSLTTNQLRTDADNAPLEDDMAKYRDWEKADKQELVGDLVEGIMNYKPDGTKSDVAQLIKQAANAPGLLRALATNLGATVNRGRR